MSTLIITRGLPASGKTTYALAWVNDDPQRRARVNRDELRNNLYGKYWGLTHDQESKISRAQQSAVRALLGAGLSVIVDDTNLSLPHAKAWAKLARDAGAGFGVIDVKTPVEECVRRDKFRGENGERAVGAEVIQSFAERYALNHRWLPDVVLEEEETPRVYVPDTTLPQTWLFDVDGTLAHMTDRGPFEWAKVGSDRPDDIISKLAEQLYIPYHVVIVSGRDAVCRPETKAWLREHNIPFDDLFMRPEGDNRKDSIVKEELFFNEIAPKYNVLGVFDDRDQVVEMWRRIGLTCLQVAPGAF